MLATERFIVEIDDVAREQVIETSIEDRIGLLFPSFKLLLKSRLRT
jgi:capsid protein